MTEEERHRQRKEEEHHEVAKNLQRVVDVGGINLTEAEKLGHKSVAHEATRIDTGCRLDLVDADFLEALGHIMYVGAKKYGPDNWRKGLPGEKSGHNHAMKHLLEFKQNIPNDYGPPEMHYAQVGINAMFQYCEERNKRLAQQNGCSMKSDYVPPKAKPDVSYDLVVAIKALREIRSRLSVNKDNSAVDDLLEKYAHVR